MKTVKVELSLSETNDLLSAVDYHIRKAGRSWDRLLEKYGDKAQKPTRYDERLQNLTSLKRKVRKAVADAR